MELRSMIQNMFGNSKGPTTVTRFRALNDYMPVFTPFGGELYDSDVVRTCIDAIARNAAKLKPRHVRMMAGEILKGSAALDYLLQTRPNPYMSAYDMIYKVVSQLYSNNNAFIYAHVEGGSITGLYPLNFSSVELVEYQGELYGKFTFGTGFQMTVPYSSLIHLRRHFNRNDIFGESNHPFKPTLSLIHTVNQGIVNAIKSSARLRGWLKYNMVLNPTDLKKNRDAFVTDYLSINNDGGIGALDTKADFTPANIEAKMADDKQMAIIRDNAYRYFGVNEKIVQSNYTEDEWSAFYESVLEPIAIQLSLEMTEKLFTPRERGHGNAIVVEANRLQYASARTKISVVNTLTPLGLLTVNEGREVFNLAPVPDGDKRLVSLNYVDAAKANQYQLDKKPQADGGDDNAN